MGGFQRKVNLWCSISLKRLVRIKGTERKKCYGDMFQVEKTGFEIHRMDKYIVR